MNYDERCVEAGRSSARKLIMDERIDNEPFVALNDLHLLRRRYPVTYQALQQTLDEKDPELRVEIDAEISRLAQEIGPSFCRDSYAEGFAERVGVVWDKIRDKV